MRIYEVTGYDLEYKTSRVAFTRKEAKYIAEEMDNEGIYRWVHITTKIVYIKKQLDAVDSYLASIGQ